MTHFKDGMPPVHPGEILREEYLVPLDMSANALAVALRVTAARINEIVREERGITPDTALRLARYFGGDARSWLNLQNNYDLKVAERAHGERIAAEITPRDPAAQAAPPPRLGSKGPVPGGAVVPPRAPR